MEEHKGSCLRSCRQAGMLEGVNACVQCLGNTKLKKNGLLANLSNCALEGDIVFIILVGKQICLLPIRET